MALYICGQFFYRVFCVSADCIPLQAASDVIFSHWSSLYFHARLIITSMCTVLYYKSYILEISGCPNMRRREQRTVSLNIVIQTLYRQYTQAAAFTDQQQLSSQDLVNGPVYRDFFQQLHGCCTYCNLFVSPYSIFSILKQTKQAQQILQYERKKVISRHCMHVSLKQLSTRFLAQSYSITAYRPLFLLVGNVHCTVILP